MLPVAVLRKMMPYCIFIIFLITSSIKIVLSWEKGLDYVM